ncbi:hypothetical protein [Pseudoscardovia suis]|uniref:Uncharacterized protein n=1 Tax=Pseudoscardovia suis TaxID=987063 RepID=A0A261EYP8_9BIFI|nr:hypothetical protein [Pseudoscardovia suis]OZG51984.1 hypothetical protein PSSU_0767 [Pseudoscardovia suis]PJJ69419.1 hypothetical protein CLV65_0120 [Pseudoscardovia suis]
MPAFGTLLLYLVVLKYGWDGAPAILSAVGRWPSIFSYMVLYLLLLICCDTDKDAGMVRGFWKIGIVMSFFTLALMVYISQREAGKKDNKAVPQGCMERVKRRLLGGEEP